MLVAARRAYTQHSAWRVGRAIPLRTFTPIRLAVLLLLLSAAVCCVCSEHLTHGQHEINGVTSIIKNDHVIIFLADHGMHILTRDAGAWPSRCFLRSLPAVVLAPQRLAGVLAPPADVAALPPAAHTNHPPRAAAGCRPYLHAHLPP